jgi:hypothetical protein
MQQYGYETKFGSYSAQSVIDEALRFAGIESPKEPQEETLER